MTIPIISSPSHSRPAGPSAPRWISALALLVLALALASVLYVLAHPATPSPQPRPPAVVLLFDISDSNLLARGSDPDVAARLDHAYLDQILELVSNSIDYDRAVFVVVVSNNNSATKLIQIPADGDDMPTHLAAREACRAAFPEVRKFLEESLRGPVSNTTDLVGALVRVSSAVPGHTLHVILGTDGLQATRGSVNLEREHVTEANVDSLVERSAPAQGVPGLAGASVQFVLPVRLANDDRFANDLGSARLFWGAWLAKFAPSASIYNFETSVRSWGDTGGCK